jgi:hypothetical protein
LDIPDVDVDPTPPPTPSESSFCMQRCESGPPRGSDEYIYYGSYVTALEKCFGFEYGERDWETYRMVGGEPGFLRTFGKERVFPLLLEDVSKLLAAYKAHPVTAYEEMFILLGAPRCGFQLNPAPIAEEPSEADTAVIAFWQPFADLYYDTLIKDRILQTMKDAAAALPAIKSDKSASLALDILARIAPGGQVFNIDTASTISSFIGTRLPDDSSHLQMFPRAPQHTTEGLNATAVRTEQIVTSV